MKTPTPRAAEIEASRKWYLIDAQGLVLGRLATKVASILRGKHKPMFMPHLDTGDFVVVINADKIRLTGRKANQKTYFHYTGYPGGGRVESFKDLMAEKPEFVVGHAIKGMLPHNRIGDQMYTKVKIYAGAEHPHIAQRPEVITLE